MQPAVRRAGPALDRSKLARGDVTVRPAASARGRPRNNRTVEEQPGQPTSEPPSAQAFDLEAALRDVREFVVCVDADYRVLYCTETYLRLLGLKRDQVVGKRVHDYVKDFERSMFFEAFQACQRSGQSSIQVGFSVVFGQHISMRLHPRPNGGFVVTGSPANKEMLRGHSEGLSEARDELTRLGNRFALTQDLARTLGTSSGCTLAVIEWSNQHQVHERLGNEAADLVVLDIVARLMTSLRKGETLYRLDQSQFALVLAALPHNGTASDRVREIVRCLQATATVESEIVTISTHVGLAHASGLKGALESAQSSLPHALSVDALSQALVRRARLALRHARAGHDGMVVAYDSKIEQRLALEGEIGEALQHGQFVMFAQPKLDLFRNRPCGAELLIRWNHPKRGLLGPGEFLTVASELKLARSLDAWVIKQAIAKLQILRDSGVGLPLAINVSVDTLSDPHFVDELVADLDAAGVEPRMLEIEIPEGALMHDVDTSASVMERLHKAGVRLSMDDFGTGYCSYSYLNIFPLDALKIDRSFIATMDSDPRKRAIVEGMVRLGQALGLKVIAEGAETYKHVEMLLDMGCSQLQGYVFGKPMPFDTYRQFIDKPVTGLPLRSDVSL